MHFIYPFPIWQSLQTAPWSTLPVQLDPSNGNSESPSLVADEITASKNITAGCGVTPVPNSLFDAFLPPRGNVSAGESNARSCPVSPSCVGWGHVRLACRGEEGVGVLLMTSDLLGSTRSSERNGDLAAVSGTNGGTTTPARAMERPRNVFWLCYQSREQVAEMVGQRYPSLQLPVEVLLQRFRNAVVGRASQWSDRNRRGLGAPGTSSESSSGKLSEEMEQGSEVRLYFHDTTRPSLRQRLGCSLSSSSSDGVPSTIFSTMSSKRPRSVSPTEAEVSPPTKVSGGCDCFSCTVAASRWITLTFSITLEVWKGCSMTLELPFVCQDAAVALWPLTRSTALLRSQCPTLEERIGVALSIPARSECESREPPCGLPKSVLQEQQHWRLVSLLQQLHHEVLYEALPSQVMTLSEALRYVCQSLPQYSAGSPSALGGRTRFREGNLAKELLERFISLRARELLERDSRFATSSDALPREGDASRGTPADQQRDVAAGLLRQASFLSTGDGMEEFHQILTVALRSYAEEGALRRLFGRGEGIDGVEGARVDVGKEVQQRVDWALARERVRQQQQQQAEQRRRGGSGNTSRSPPPALSTATVPASLQRQLQRKAEGDEGIAEEELRSAAEGNTTQRASQSESLTQSKLKKRNLFL